MTIAPLPSPYNDSTHLRVLRIDLEPIQAIAHFKLGRFVETAAPAMPYSGEAFPPGWAERAEYNTAPLPPGVTSLGEVIAAIAAELNAHA